MDSTGNTNTDINYGLGGSGSYLSRSTDAGTDINDIFDTGQKEYVKSLALSATTPQVADTTNADYYPGSADDRNVIKGYYEGSILGHMPLVANSEMFPFAAEDAAKKQKQLYQQAQDNLYMQSLQQNYSHIKDAVKDNLFGKQQYQAFEDARKQYTDKLGEFVGTIAFRNSNDYKKLKYMFNGFANTFDDTWDAANQVILEYQSGGGSSTTDKTTEKSDVETGDVITAKETQSKYPEHYISQSTYDAAQNFRYASTKENVSLDDIQDLMKYKQQMQMGIGLDKAASPVAATLSKDATDEIGSYAAGSTSAEKAFLIKTQTGKSVDGWAYQTHQDKDGNIVIDKDEKGNKITSPAFDSLYKQWSYAPEEQQPSKDDVVEHIKKLTTDQTKLKLEKVATDAAAFEKNEIARKRLAFDEEKEKKPYIITPTKTQWTDSSGKTHDTNSIDLTNFKDKTSDQPLKITVGENEDVRDMSGKKVWNATTKQWEYPKVPAGTYDINTYEEEDGTNNSYSVISSPNDKGKKVSTYRLDPTATKEKVNPRLGDAVNKNGELLIDKNQQSTTTTTGNVR